MWGEICMHVRGQSAIEFISVYGFALLIIGTMIALVAVFINVPKVTYHFGCASYGGFVCEDVALSPNSLTSHSSLYVFLSNRQPGIINISTFNAVIDNIKSTSGSCSPIRTIQGNTVTCVADMPLNPKVSGIYTGYFYIKADYCAPPPYLEANTVCSANGNLTFTGSVSVQSG